jgi:hypothetical protein
LEFSLAFQPIPESGDFREDVGNANISALREQYDQHYNLSVGRVMQDAWERLHEILTRLSK